MRINRRLKIIVLLTILFICVWISKNGRYANWKNTIHLSTTIRNVGSNVIVQDNLHRISTVRVKGSGDDYLIPNEGICRSIENDVRLLILVCTRITNFLERQTLRKTFLNKYIGNGGNVRYVFLLGRNFNSENQTALENESLTFGDLLQENFIDTYHNLTLKTIMGFKWVSKYCRNARFVLKVDDDVFVNVENLLRATEQYGVALQSSIGGLCVRGSVPYRGSGSKWDVTLEEYPNKTYPPYCSGTGYITSTKVASDIYDISRSSKVHYLKIEDAYIGICAKHLGYRMTNIYGFGVQGNERLYNAKIGQNKCTIITVHPVTASQIERLWNVKCKM